MEQIKTQDCYLPVDDVFDLKLFAWSYKRAEWESKEYLKKHTNMVVLTKEQYDKNIEDAKTEAIKNIVLRQKKTIKSWNP